MFNNITLVLNSMTLILYKGTALTSFDRGPTIDRDMPVERKNSHNKVFTHR